MKFIIKDRRGNYQNKLFMLLYLMAVMPLLIGGIISYKIYIEEMTKQTDLSMKAMETQIYNDVEVTLSAIKQYYLDIASKREIKWLKNTRDIPYENYSNVSDAQTLLKGPTYLDEYVGNYAFMNIESGWILTNNGMYSMEEVRNKLQLQTFMKSVNQNPSSLFWYNNIAEPSPFSNGVFRSNTLDVSGYQLVMKISGDAEKKEQMLFVQLELSKLEQQLRNNLALYELCIIGKDGKILYASDDLLGTYCSDYIEELEKNMNARTVRIGKETEYRIHTKESRNNGIVYIMAYNTNRMNEGAEKILFVFIFLIVMMAVLLVISRLLSAVLYRPIKNLIIYMSDLIGAEKTDGDEFSSIKGYVKYLMDAKDNLQLMLMKQQKMLIEQFLIRSVCGGMTPEATHQAQEQFQLSKVKVYWLMAVECMLEQEYGHGSGFEKEALCITIIEQLPEEIISEVIGTPFHVGEQLLILLGNDTEEKLSARTKWVHEKLTVYIKQEFDCSIISGISQKFSGLKYLRTAFNECTELLRDTGDSLCAHSDIVFYDASDRGDAIISGYDFVIENSMMKAVNDGDGDAAAQLVDKFVNSLNNRKIMWHDRSLFLCRMTVSVLSVLSDAGLSANQVFKDRSDDIFLQLNYIFDSEQLKTYMNSQIIQPAITALYEFRYKSSSDVLHKILESINRAGGDITLAECAEEINYHSSYIWKVLKAERNMTFTDLTNLAKLKTAKDLLLHSELSVAEIAKQLNYSNTQNFIRFFSKYVDMTPGKYRKEKRDIDY